MIRLTWSNRRMASRSLVKQLVSCGLFWVFAGAIAPNLAAQPPSDWEVLRIFVPESDVGALVPQDYTLVELDALQEELRLEAARRDELLLDGPRIDSATYVVQLVNGNLVSEASRWRVTAPRAESTLRLENLGLALRSSSYTPLGHYSLISNLKYSLDGVATLSGIPTEANYWFGFSCSPRRSSGTETLFDVELPKATVGRMLIATPDNVQLSSADVVIRSVDDVRQELPDDWPVFNGFESGRWHLIHLSGMAKFGINVQVTSKRDAFTFQRLVRKSDLSYQMSSAGLSVSADFELDRVSDSEPLLLGLESTLRLRSASCDAAPMEWRVRAAEGLQASQVELLVPLGVEGRATIHLEAIQPLQFPVTMKLPGIALAKAYSWEGRTRVALSPELMVDDLQVRAVNEGHRPFLEYAPNDRVWQCVWRGPAPLIEGGFSTTKPVWTASTFTRLNPQSDSLSATTNIRLSCNNPQSNQVSLVVGGGWFLDDISVEPSELDYRVQLPDDNEPNVIIMWERPSESVAIDVQVSAHRPLELGSDARRLDAPRVVSIVSATQDDMYGLEQASGLQIEPDVELQQLQVDVTGLRAWQSRLLARPTETLLYRGQGADVPALSLKRAAGSYTAKIVIVARPEGDQVVARYLMEITPVAGIIESVNFLATSLNLNLGPTWQILSDEYDVDPISSAATGYATAQSGRKSKAASDQLTDIQLPVGLASKFMLRCETRLPLNNGRFELPLISSPSSLATITMLIVPKQFTVAEEVEGLESLPSGACCLPGEFPQSMTAQADSLATYRYDPHAISSVVLEDRSSGNARDAWVWESELEHWLFDDGRMEHNCIWEMYAASPQVTSFEWPHGWVLDRLSVNGQAQELSPTMNALSHPVKIPKGQRVRVQAHFSSQVRANGWLSAIQLDRPSVALNTLQMSEFLWLQPGKIALHTLVDDHRYPWYSSLTPSSWWQWLNPGHRFDASREGRSLSDISRHWSMIEPITASIWLLDRSAFAALLIASLFVASCCWLWLMRLHGLLWFVAWPTVVVTALLLDARLTLLCHWLVFGLAIATAIKLTSIVAGHRARQAVMSGRRGSTIVHRSAIKASGLVLLYCFLETHAIAQVSESAERAQRTIFGVIIPVNDEGELASEHVYAPVKLTELLENSNVPNGEGREPKILGARYYVKLRSGSNLSMSTAQDFTVELDLYFPTKGGSIRLPFKNSEVQQLLRGYVFGQEVFIGSQLQRTNDAIVYYPQESGRERLRLQLIPLVHEEADRTSIKLTVPPVATATLEVQTDEPMDVRVDGRGQSQRTTGNNWFAELGPTQQLKVSWPTRSTRQPSITPTQVLSDTWLHVLGGHLMAECQLRISGAQSLPSIVRVAVDAGWEPVGSDWGDGSMVSSELAPTGNRRIYSVELKPGVESATLRVLMLPKNIASLSTTSLPFLSLQEGATAARTLAISSSMQPGSSHEVVGWRLNGADQWFRSNQTLSELQWPPAPALLPTVIYKVPSGPINATIQRVSSTAAVDSVDEHTSLELALSGGRIKYHVDWLQSNNPRSQLLVELPANAVAEKVLLDGQPVKHSTIKRHGQTHLLVHTASPATLVSQLDVELLVPLQLEESGQLPRVLLEEVEVVNSLYRVWAAANLKGSLTSNPESSLLFDKPSGLDNADLLRSLATCIGEAELGGEFRESTQLPVSFEVSKRLPLQVTSHIMTLARSEQGWRANVDVVFPPSETSEFVFFDVPSTLKGMLEQKELPQVILPEASGRTTLAVLRPRSLHSSSRVAFSFRLPIIGSSQSISIPDLRLLNSSLPRPVLGLPNRIDQQAVRWSRTGTRLSDEWARSRTLGIAAEEYAFFELDGLPLQASWRAVQEDDKLPEILHATAVLKDSADAFWTGTLEYWIEPNNHLELTANVPAGCELVGVQVGGSNAVWSLTGHKLRVLMQPSYLPVRLSMFVRWPEVGGAALDRTGSEPLVRNAATSGGLILAMPKIEATGNRRLFLTTHAKFALDSLSCRAADAKGEDFSIAIRTMTAVQAIEQSRTVAAMWKTQLMRTLPVVSDLRTDELASWINDWHYANMGIESNLTIAKDPYGISVESEQDTVDQFWHWYIGQLDPGVSQIIDEAGMRQMMERSSDQLNHVARLRESQWFEVEAIPDRPWSLVLTQSQTEHGWSLRLATAFGVVCLACLARVSYLRYRFVGLELLASQPWLYWLFLSFVAWQLLPIAWPALVVLASALGMLVGQLLSQRKRISAYRRA